MSSYGAPAVTRTIRNLPRVVALFAAGLVLAACGGAGASSSTNGKARDGAAFPVTIEHKYGTTEITSEPQRIVTLGLSDHDVVLALGSKPVGVVDWFKERPFGIWPWAQPLWGDIQPDIVGERDEYNMEKIAALKPDLIIAQYSGMKKEQYETLSKITKVVAQPPQHEDYQAPWQVMTRVIGKALGKEAKANELIAGIDKRFEEVRTAHPEFAGKTTAVAELFEAGKYSAFSPNDPKMLFLSQLGFTTSPQYRQAVGSQNVADFSFERFDLVDVDRLVWFTSGPDTEKMIKGEKLYSQLKVAQESRDVFFDYQAPPIAAAMSFNTVLSIPYAIDQVVPVLAQK